MDEKDVLHTPIADVYMDGKGIMYAAFCEECSNVEDAKKYNLLIQEKYGADIAQYIIADLRKTKKTTKEVRNYFNSPDVNRMTAASAIVISSGLSKIVGNLFLKFSRPKYPTKIFTDLSKARNWILAQKNL